MVDDTSGRLLVVMPTYNEAATVRKVVERVRAAVPAADVLIVDDSLARRNRRDR